MRNNFGSEISDAGKSTLLAIIELPCTNFSELVALAKLDKERDFIGSDLSEVDFSASDLRGFNFSGANLSGTYGVNVIFDDTTNLSGANVAGSILNFEKERRDFIRNNSDDASLLFRLEKEYWTRGAVWVSDNLRKGAKNFSRAAKIAKFLYFRVNDQTYKNQILYGLRGTFESKTEYKDFLLAQLANPISTSRTVRSAIDILLKMFSSDATVKRSVLLFLGNPDKNIRKACIPAVMSPRFFDENRESIIFHVNSERDAEVRSIYTRYFAERVGYGKTPLFRDKNNSFHDYAVPIDERTFENMALRTIKLEKITARAKYSTSSGIPLQNYSFAEVSYVDFLKSVSRFDEYFRKVIEIGLPIKIKYSKEKYLKELKTFLDKNNNNNSIVS